jgi:hypothetical protein
LRAFQPFLKSIDMRTIAVSPSPSEEWENLVTSMVVSEKSVAEVKEEQSNLPKIRTNQIALFTYTGAFDFSIFEDFIKGSFGYNRVLTPLGSVAFGSLRVETRQFNPLDLKMVSQQRRIEGVLKWVLSAAGSNTSPEREQLWSIVQNQAMIAKLHGYSSMEELIKEILQIENISHNIDFRLSIFDLAKIRNVNFSDSSFEVEIEKVKGLKDLQLNVKVERTTDGGFQRTVLKKPFPLDKCEEEPSGKLYRLKKTVEQTLSPFDLVQLELIHRNSILTLDQTWMRAPIKNPVEPFYNVLTAFCSLDKFRNMLLKPEDFKNAPEKMFENAVAWLLSLAGFHTIYLGANSKATKMQFDKLSKFDKYHIGSADIIAYEDNERLLLVDCDLGGLDEMKIQKLTELAKHFKGLCEYEKLEFMPVLFTPKYFGEDMKKKPVAVVDGNIIEGILEDLAKGDRENARSRIRCLFWSSY